VEYLAANQVAVDAVVHLGRMDPPPEPDLFTTEVLRMPFAFTMLSTPDAEKCSGP
jgi:hypothetical protein